VNAEVVLIPGLWMPAAAMAYIAARLAKAGFRTHRFGYWGRAPLEANIERLARFIDGRRNLHLVGHSLGGVLIYDTLRRHPELACGRIVLLGAPVRGCFAGRRLEANAFGRWFMGACAARWAECDARWQRPEALGVVAGTLPLGLGRALGALPGDNDGVVRVEETAVEGMTERVVVRLGHSMLPVSREVAGLVHRFLAGARFA
jgi:pimeloyl-ACP methyl ester carboxylesterase